MKPLCILVTGTPVPRVAERRGSFVELIKTGAAAWRGPFAEVDAREGTLPDVDGFAGIVVTGSAASVTSRDAWILKTEEWLRRAVASDVPTLGICFGHQLLGQALGGLVEKNPRGREIGTTEVELLAADPLLDQDARPFRAHMTHVDSVTRLPPGAQVLARTAIDPHAAVRFGPRTWGVQFHPEFDADVMRGYLESRMDVVRGEGLDADALLAGVREAEPGAAVLARFIAHAVPAD